MNEVYAALIKTAAAQGPYAAMLLGGLLYLNGKLNKSEKAREELNDLLLEQNKEHLAAAVKTAEALMGLKSIIERLMDRVPPAAAIEHTAVMTDKPKGVLMTLTQWLAGKPLPNRAKESTERNIRAYVHQRDLAQQVTTALNELESTMVAGARRR